MRPIILIPVVAVGAVLLAGLTGGLLGNAGYSKAKTPEPSGTLSTDPKQALVQLFSLYGSQPQTNITSKGKSGRSYQVVLWEPRDPAKPKYILYIAGVDTATVYVATIDGATVLPLVNIVQDATAQSDIARIQQSL